MPQERLGQALSGELASLAAQGRRKGRESVITAIVPPTGERGPRYHIAGAGTQTFLRMNANNYLGMSTVPEVLAAEEAAVRAFGAGPGAVRFISGTWAPHVELEASLAAFHGRAAAMIFSSAYATVVGVIAPLVTAETAVISDELNHNSIINAIRLTRPAQKAVYGHLDYAELDTRLREAAGKCRRAVVVTDGIFSMRGDHADLPKIMAIAARHDAAFPENVVVIADDSHGVGAFGATGRGTEEHVRGRVDVLIGTLGKAFGVNGGYVVGSERLVEYLRETAPMYIYSNPITPGEAAAAAKVIDLIDQPEGQRRLVHLRAMTERFASGLVRLGFETIAGQHPIVPLLLRDSDRTSALVEFLRACGILATGLKFPVVPRGDEEIRFQICADHTQADIDEVLAVLADSGR
jgi:glycine C-acetyltransferase